MDIPFILLCISCLCTTYLAIKVGFQLEEAKEEIRHYRFWHSRMTDHIWQNANFKDRNGKSEGGYDCQEVANQWKVFHELEREFYDTEQ